LYILCGKNKCPKLYKTRVFATSTRHFAGKPQNILINCQLLVSCGAAGKSAIKMHSKWGRVGGREMGDKGSSAAKEISISIDFFPGDKVGVKKKLLR